MVETAVGFVLGAVIGSIATATGSYALYWKRERDATRRLRRAFLEELRAYDYVDDLAADGAYEQLTVRVEEPVIYHSTAGDLGLLTESEIGSLVSFYAAISWLQGLEDPEDKKERIEEVAQKRRRALETLERAAGE